MPRFSANLSMLYAEHAFLDRFARAAADGFRAVEYVGAYAYEPSVIADLLAQHDLTQVLFNLPAGDWDGGERGIACLPDRRDEFEASVHTAIEYATALGCQRVNCLAGLAPAGADRQLLENVLVDNLRYAAPRLADHGIRLLLEPINQRDMPGFFVTGTAQAERIFERANCANLFLQYDFYHQQVTQGDLLPTFERLMDRIAHVQIADTPGRHEPGTGEINYTTILRALDQLGYDGWVGCEYRPKGTTSEGLGWMAPFVVERPGAR